MNLLNSTLRNIHDLQSVPVQMPRQQGISQMKTEAEKKIGKILADVWGGQFAEPVKMEVEDEQEN